MLDKILMFIKTKLVALNTAINGVSNRVSNLESDTGWKQLSRATNWNGTDDYVAYRKLGNTVEIRFKVEPSKSWNTSNSILLASNMPSDIIPTDHTVRSTVYHAGKIYFIIIPGKGMTNAGQVRIQGADVMSTGYWVTGQVCYTV